MHLFGLAQGLVMTLDWVTTLTSQQSRILHSLIFKHFCQIMIFAVFQLLHYYLHIGTINVKKILEERVKEIYNYTCISKTPACMVLCHTSTKKNFQKILHHKTNLFFENFLVFKTIDLNPICSHTHLNQVHPCFP